MRARVPRPGVDHAAPHGLDEFLRITKQFARTGANTAVPGSRRPAKTLAAPNRCSVVSGAKLGRTYSNSFGNPSAGAAQGVGRAIAGKTPARDAGPRDRCRARSHTPMPPPDRLPEAPVRPQVAGAARCQRALWRDTRPNRSSYQPSPRFADPSENLPPSHPRRARPSDLGGQDNYWILILAGVVVHRASETRCSFSRSASVHRALSS